MKVMRYCPFCKIEHEVTYKGTCCVQLVDEDILMVYKFKFNRNFKIKEYNEDRNYN